MSDCVTYVEDNQIVCREDDDAIQPIASMPGVSRYGNNKLKEFLEPLVNNGLSSVLLFGVMDGTPKVSYLRQPMKRSFHLEVSL